MNTKMKVLSLALVGLGGLAFAGVSMAACPTSAVPPWTSVTAFQGTASIVTPGYAGTECRLESKFNAGATSVATAAVNYTNDAAEPAYRAGFILNVDGLVNQSFTQFVKVFSALGTGAGVEFYVLGDGSGGHTLNYVAKNESLPNSYASGSVSLSSGENTIQFSLQGAGTATSTFSLWVNNTNETTPNEGPLTVNTTALGGIKSVTVGMSSPSAVFASTFAGAGVGFDQFDSRRNSFITF